MTLSVDRVTLRTTRGGMPVRALLIDHQARVLGSTCPGRGAGHLFARRMIRGSLDRLRRVGVRIAVVSGDRLAPWPPQYDVVESILGPVDLWCGAEHLGAESLGVEHPGLGEAEATELELGADARVGGSIHDGSIHDGRGIRDGSHDLTGHLVLAAAAMALGLELRACAVATDVPSLATVARHAGARVVLPGAAGHRGRSHHTALALSGAVDGLLAELELPPGPADVATPPVPPAHAVAPSR